MVRGRKAPFRAIRFRATNTDLILRSLRSKRLEGWRQRDSWPILRDARSALLRMRSEFLAHGERAQGAVSSHEYRPHPEELAKQASRRMATKGLVAHPSRRAFGAPQDEV